MGRCGCGQSCDCVITAGENVVITGTGTVDDPYVVTVVFPDE